MTAESEEPVRTVFDCMVLLQSVRRRRSPSLACLQLAERGTIQLLISQAVLDEVRDVLGRPKVVRRFPELTEVGAANAFVARLQSIATHVDPVPGSIVLSRDPKDSPYLNLAIAGRASYLVTRDKDLLAVASDTDSEAIGIRNRLGACRVVTPETFLKQVRACTGDPGPG